MSMVESESELSEASNGQSSAGGPESVRALLPVMGVNEKIARARRSYLAWVALQNAGNSPNRDASAQ